MMGSLLIKTAGLKRFRSHPLVQRQSGDEQEKLEESDCTEEFDVLLGASLQETALFLQCIRTTSFATFGAVPSQGSRLARPCLTLQAAP